MATPWNAALSTGTDTTFDASAYMDLQQGLGLFVVADAAFWVFSGSWVDGTTNSVTVGAAGRGSKLPAGAYSWRLTDTETLKFRSVAGATNLEGVVTPF